VLALALAAGHCLPIGSASADACTRPSAESGIEFLSGDELRQEIIGNSITWEDEGVDFVEHYAAGTTEGEVIGLQGEQPYGEVGRWRISGDCLCLKFENDPAGAECYTIGQRRDREAKRGAIAALVFYTADGRKEGPADLWPGNLAER
jgi:hypothetical protein